MRRNCHPRNLLSGIKRSCDPRLKLAGMTVSSDSGLIMRIVKMKKRISLLFFAALFLCVQPGNAAVPKLLTYQGILKNGSGSYLTGTYPIIFRLYSASTGGSALWSETQPSVSVSSGKFVAPLGSVTVLNLDFNSDYWLSLQVGTDPEMSSRTRLTSAPYNIRADYENNGFTQSQHDALSHENVKGVKDNIVNLAKTNFKLDAYTLATANSMGALIVDSFNDATGVNAAGSLNYTYRGSPNFDVTLALTGGGILQQCTVQASYGNFLNNSNPANYNGNGQTFKLASTKIVDKASFMVRRNGNPSGNIRFRLYATSAGLPTTMLAESANVVVSSIPTTAGELTVSFSPVTLSANIDYAIVMENYDATGDASNNLEAMITNVDVTYGARVMKNTSGAWISNSEDMYFKIYEQVTYPGTATVISNTYSQSTVPSEAMVIADETLGAGTITYYVSRDGGTSWTQCNKETVTNISSQPSGTQVAWKAVITGNAELNAIAVAV